MKYIFEKWLQKREGMTKMFQKKSALSLEWEKLQKKEKKFLQAREQKKDSLINQKLEEKVPD